MGELSAVWASRNPLAIDIHRDERWMNCPHCQKPIPHSVTLERRRRIREGCCAQCAFPLTDQERYHGNTHCAVCREKRSHAPSRRRRNAS